MSDIQVVHEPLFDILDKDPYYNKPEISILNFPAGILICSKVREFLKLCKFKGYKFEWYEVKDCWIEHRFYLKGEKNHIITIYNTLKANYA